MDAKRIWDAARAGDGQALTVDGVLVPVEVVAALRVVPAPDATGVIVTFGAAPDRQLVVRNGVAALDVVR